MAFDRIMQVDDDGGREREGGDDGEKMGWIVRWNFTESGSNRMVTSFMFAYTGHVSISKLTLR
jgi:hypothetical protein